MARRRLDPAEVYRRLAPAVLGYLRGQRAPEPEDLLGEVFLQIARDAHKFSGDGPEDERRWVFTVARHRAIDARRRAARRPAITDVPLEEHAPAAPPPADPVDPQLVEALHRLTEDQREVVLLRFVADLPLSDVAMLMSRSVNATKQLQHRAVAALREQLATNDPLSRSDHRA